MKFVKGMMIGITFGTVMGMAIGAMNAELKSKKWLWAGIGLQFGVGYSIGFLTFFFGTLFTTRSFGPLWIPILGWSLVGAFLLSLTILVIRNRTMQRATANLASASAEKKQYSKV